jgi:hypothetical protein
MVTPGGSAGSAQVLDATKHHATPGARVETAKSTCTPTVESTVIHAIPGLDPVADGTTALPPTPLVIVTVMSEKV